MSFPRKEYLSYVWRDGIFGTKPLFPVSNFNHGLTDSMKMIKLCSAPEEVALSAALK
jgi:hypothetical protein